MTGTMTYRAIETSGEETQPLDTVGLRRLEREGRIIESSLVRAEGGGNWVPFGSIRGQLQDSGDTGEKPTTRMYLVIDVNGKQPPPLDALGVQYMEAVERINATSLIRVEGEGNWVPFGSIREQILGPRNATSGRTTSKAGTVQPVATATGQPLVGPGIPAGFGYAAEPWSRLWAYLVDRFLLMIPGNIVIALLLGLVGILEALDRVPPEAKMRPNQLGYLIGFICCWTIVPSVIAASQAMFGTTPGKAMFGIRVLASDGSRPAFSVLLVRNYRVLTQGLFLNIPFLLLAGIAQFHRNLKKGVPPNWDDDQSRAYQRDPTKNRKSAMVGAVILVFALWWVDLVLGLALLDLAVH